jgi:hypothetical protein
VLLLLLLLLQELRSRGVAQQHIDAAMSAVFGPGRQLPGRDAANDQEEGEPGHLVALAGNHQLGLWPSAWESWCSHNS